MPAADVLAELRATSDRADDLLTDRDQLVVTARAAGATWPQIAEAVNMSRVGVILLHRRLASPDTADPS